MAEERDQIVEDIESSLAKVGPGYRMTIHPNGLVEIFTGEFARQVVYGNPHYSCCCCGG